MYCSAEHLIRKARLIWIATIEFRKRGAYMNRFVRGGYEVSVDRQELESKALLKSHEVRYRVRDEFLVWASQASW